MFMSNKPFLSASETTTFSFFCGPNFQIADTNSLLFWLSQSFVRFRCLRLWVASLITCLAWPQQQSSLSFLRVHLKALQIIPLFYSVIDFPKFCIIRSTQIFLWLKSINCGGVDVRVKIFALLNTKFVQFTIWSGGRCPEWRVTKQWMMLLRILCYSFSGTCETCALNSTSLEYKGLSVRWNCHKLT